MIKRIHGRRSNEKESHLVCFSSKFKLVSLMKCIRAGNIFSYIYVSKSKGSSNDTFLCSEMQNGPYDAYMEFPYKNMDKDTKLGLPYSYDR